MTRRVRRAIIQARQHTRRTSNEATEPDQGRHARRPQGVWLRSDLPRPWVIDILGKFDFDYVFIDGEHGPFDLERLEDLAGPLSAIT